MTRLRFIALLAAILMLLAACETKTNDQPPQDTPTDTAPATSDKTPEIIYDFEFTRANFPRMDGSTATIPLAEAAACVLLGEPRENVASLVEFNRTTQSFRNLAAGLCDILIVSEPAPEVFVEMDRQGFRYEIAPIATDALVFVVNASNPIESLTIDQIQMIYMGKVLNWSAVGGDDIEIAAFQRNAEAGSQVLMEKLVMAGLKMTDPIMEQVFIAFGMGDLIEALKGFDSSANAIGYTLYYYAEDMRMAEGLKIISVEGIKPGPDTIQSGEYPFLNPYFTVIGADEPERSPARIVYNWLQSDDGQALIRHEGYVSVR